MTIEEYIKSIVQKQTYPNLIKTNYTSKFTIILQI